MGCGPQWRGGGSLVFEPWVRGGSFNFQLPIGVGHLFFFRGIDVHTFDTIDNKGNSFQTIESDTLKHQPTVRLVPYACAKPYPLGRVLRKPVNVHDRGIIFSCLKMLFTSNV